MYALLGDIHSSKTDLEAVLEAIGQYPEQLTVIGTGDIFECTISKKDIGRQSFHALREVMILPEGFESLLQFPTVRGNQEERIQVLCDSSEETLLKLHTFPEKLTIEGATVIHGHQWQWGGDPWALQKAQTDADLTFFGHSHTPGLCINGQWIQVEIDQPYDVSQGKVLVNVGAVIHDRAWLLYDSKKERVYFKQVA